MEIKFEDADRARLCAVAKTVGFFAFALGMAVLAVVLLIKWSEAPGAVFLMAAATILVGSYMTSGSIRKGNLPLVAGCFAILGLCSAVVSTVWPFKPDASHIEHLLANRIEHLFEVSVGGLPLIIVGALLIVGIHDFAVAFYKVCLTGCEVQGEGASVPPESSAAPSEVATPPAP